MSMTSAASKGKMGARAAHTLGLADSPKRKRTAPRVAAGVVIEASAVYLLNR